MNLKNRWLWVGIGVLVAITLLSLFVAPRSANLQEGSTYSRSPSGYGAWYAYMESENLPIQRWQRPPQELFDSPPPAVKGVSSQLTPPLVERKPETQEITWTAQSSSPSSSPSNPLVTLLQINVSELGSQFDEDWVKQGNQVVLIGIRTPATRAPFRSQIDSPVGAVQIETTRRFNRNAGRSAEQNAKPLLEDAFGAVVWQRQIGKGKLISISTPHFAANAYQDAPGNFKYLAGLASQPGYPIYVDEYMHGYKDQETLAAETGNLLSYLAKTPLLLVAIQATLILAVLIWGQNQRLGPAQRIQEPPLDNSAAYIQAMTDVLQKANCSDFVVETIGKAEQTKIQRLLGLGAAPVDPQTLIDAWVQQTGRPASELQALLQPVSNPPRLTDSALLQWLDALQKVRRQLDVS